jgi:hypothetical protein
MRLKTIIIPVLLFLTGLFIPGCELFQGSRYCSDYSTEDLTLNETVDFNYSELYCHSKYDLSLSFDSLNDSRCPIGAACIWGGNARVKLHIQQSRKGTSTFWLNTHSSFLTDTVVNGLHYELIDILPHREIGMDYTLDDIILQLKISD